MQRITEAKQKAPKLLKVLFLTEKEGEKNPLKPLAGGIKLTPLRPLARLGIFNP